MTEPNKTEQAKREIAERAMQQILEEYPPGYMDIRGALIRERARNLELREQIEKLKTAANTWKGSSDGWDSWG
jgi:hypothetical protein